MTPEIRKLLEACRHEFTTLGGLVAYDGAAPTETFTLEFTKILNRLDEMLARTCCRKNCGRLGVEQSGDGIRWYCERHWKEAIDEGNPSRGY